LNAGHTPDDGGLYPAGHGENMGRSRECGTEDDEKESTTVYLRGFVLKKIKKVASSQYMSATAWIERAVNRQLMQEMESPEVLRQLCDMENGKSKVEKIK